MSHNAPCLPPPPRQKNLALVLVIVGEMKHKGYAKLCLCVGGGATKVYYGRCANGEWVMAQSN